MEDNDSLEILEKIAESFWNQKYTYSSVDTTKKLFLKLEHTKKTRNIKFS